MSEKARKQDDVEEPQETPPDRAHEREHRGRDEPAPAGEELARLRQEKDRLEGQLKRAMADVQNMRRRHLKEMEEARNLALESLASELLPVLDNFHLALDAHERHESGGGKTEARAMRQGLEMVQSLLHGVLERHGLTEIPASGARFDPNVHEAVGIDPTAEAEPGMVSKVVQRGYSLRDKVIRPTKVLVAGAGAGGDDAGEAAGPEAGAEPGEPGSERPDEPPREGDE